VRNARLLVLATALGFMLPGCNNRTPSTAGEIQKAVPQVADLGEVTYDHRRPSTIPNAKVQVLVDSSASMAGFSSFDALLHAIDQGLSYSRDLYFRVDSKRTCSFNQSSGISGCQSRIDGAHIPKATGYTNLDRAVAATSDFDLSVIITDGVPAGADSGGPNHCMGSGVDAGCVADAMAEAVRGAPGTPGERMRGVWIVPLVSPYHGTFFAEQKIALSEFNAVRAEDSVRAALGVNARVTHPRPSSDGTLIFDYEGPRYLLAIVIGDLNVGRAFLQELYARSDFSNIAKLQEPSSYATHSGSGAVLLPAVEVFPSALPEQSYGACQQKRDARHRIVGGLVNCRVSEPNHLRLSCGESAVTMLELGRNVPADAMRIRMIAPVRFGNSGGNIVTGLDIPTGLEGIPRVLLKVSCDGRKRVGCGTTAASTQLTTTPDFQAAANAITSGQTAGAKYAQAMSTRSPASDPGKVYGLGDLLQNFYRRQLPEGTSAFATLEVCQE
jgi:hypothetical protein